MKNESGKISITIGGLLLIIFLLIIIIGGLVIYKENVNEKNANISEQNSYTELEEQEVSKNNSYKNESLNKSTKELSDTEKEELFNKIIENKPLLQKMIMEKDFSKKDFQDEEIIKILPILDESKFTDVESEDDFYVSTKIDTIQELSKKYFDKELNIDNLTEKKSNGEIIISFPSGFGIVEYKLISVEKIAENNYSIKFEYNEENVVEQYILTVKYLNNSIKYLSLENDKSTNVGCKYKIFNKPLAWRSRTVYFFI